MDQYCINHSLEKAVGLCGTCARPACYRCSMCIDQVIYCSPECFNSLNPPSSGGIPEQTRVESRSLSEVDPGSSDLLPRPSGPSSSEALASDEYSDVMIGIASKQGADPAGSEPSVILSPQDATDDRTTILGMSSVQDRGFDGSTLVLIPGTRRALISSSCFFHPDTSAIVLCAECRNPICSLCARETPEGLACSPACGPPDPVGARDRRRLTILNVVIAVVILLVLLEGFLFLRASLRADLSLTRTQVEAPAGPPRPAVPLPEPATSARPGEEPIPIQPTEPEPVKAEIPKPETPSPAEPAKPEASPKEDPPQPAPPPPDVEIAKSAPVPAPAPAPVVQAEPSRPEPTPEPVVRAEPPKPEPTAFELDSRWAALLLREAMPLLEEVADKVYPKWKPGTDPDLLAAKLSVITVKLKQVREIYVRRLGDAPDPELLKRRMETIATVLDGLEAGLEAIRAFGRNRK